ncbi:MAG: isochorismatase family protein, partial [Eubacteriales bacterium]|nr:isochorismatase family protein [Eubacteriales bacterium]
MNKALVIIDIQNDITKHYKDIVEGIHTAIEWAQKNGMHIVYIKHNNDIVNIPLHIFLKKFE